MDPVARDCGISMSKRISRRAGEDGEETDIVRVERLTEGLINAIRGYCFCESARPEEVEMRKNSRSKRSPWGVTGHFTPSGAEYA